MPKQPVSERVRNFSEVALGYTPKMAVSEAQRCLQCKKPLCMDGCPVEIDIPAFIKLIAEGEFEGAAREIKKNNILPAMCGRVCPQENQCEKVCVLAKKGAPVAIGRLERFAADWEAQKGKILMPEIRTPKKRGKVAIVGCGPAGITAASELAIAGHEVTIFEALHEPGGVLMYGIPEFRLPKAVVMREIEFLKALGVKIMLSHVIGKVKLVDEILEDFHAVFIGTGAGLPWFMEIPGENFNGVYSANEFLTRVNLMKGYRFPECDTPVHIGKRVVVIGGGNVAMDAARSALRLGAEDVRVVYRRSRAEMPARVEEIENAEEEGVIFEFLTLPLRYISDNFGWIKEIECIRMKLGPPDESGRRRPIPIPGSEFRISVDTAIVAIGQSPNPLIPSTTSELEVTKRGTIVVDENYRTKKPRVWAGGDVTTGAATVISAMGAGRTAARSIARFIEE